jgi:hypothetical protein
MSSDYVGMRLSGSGLRYSQQPSFLQLLQSEVGLVTLLAGLLLTVFLYLNRQVQASQSAPRRCIDLALMLYRPLYCPACAAGGNNHHDLMNRATNAAHISSRPIFHAHT